MPLPQGRLGWWIQPGECITQPCAPSRQLHHHRLGVRQQQFRWAEAGASLLLGWRPQPDAATRSLASRPAASLIRTRKAGGNGLEALHAGVWIEAQLPAQAAVDHQAHAVNGDRAFGNSTGQHQLAVAVGRAAFQRIALALQRQLAMEGADLPVPEGIGVLQPFPAALDLCQSRQKHQHSTAFREIKAMGLHGTEHLLRKRFVRPRGLVKGVDWVGSSFAGQHRGLGQP